METIPSPKLVEKSSASDDLAVLRKTMQTSKASMWLRSTAEVGKDGQRGLTG
jgi:hypothetical protein